ncbi:MAPEG family protein [soil metagenome]
MISAMTPALTALGWTLVLAIVQIFLAAGLRTQETGLGYNASARDSGGPPVGKVTGRLMRAQANLFETLSLFAAAVLIAVVAGRDNRTVDLAAWTYLGARIVYVPLYALGVPFVRTLVFLLSVVALIAIICTILRPA